MAVVHTLESPTGQELWKWDHTTAESISVGGQTIFGKRPTHFTEYPAMMYKAEQSPLGSIRFDGQIAHTETERSHFESIGYVWGGQDKALDKFHGRNQEIAILAANRAYSDRKMSPEAQAEAQEADDSTSRHLAEIPALPIKRRGRPKKQTAPPVEG